MLSPASPIPLYRQLADALAARISSGELAVGDRLPSEPELAKAHSIGRPTVRQATDLLVQRGLIERRRGAGTFVRARAPGVDLFSLAGTLSSFQKSGLPLETRLLERVARRRVPEGAPGNPFAGREASSFVRLGSVDGAPVLVEHVYLDPLVFPDLQRVPLARASLAEIVRERYLMEPEGGEQSFVVAVPEPAVRRALELSPRESVLLIRRTLNFPRAPGALFAELHCRTDRVTFTQRLGTAAAATAEPPPAGGRPRRAPPAPRATGDLA